MFHFSTEYLYIHMIICNNVLAGAFSLVDHSGHGGMVDLLSPILSWPLFVRSVPSCALLTTGAYVYVYMYSMYCTVCTILYGVLYIHRNSKYTLLHSCYSFLPPSPHSFSNQYSKKKFFLIRIFQIIVNFIS